MTRGAEAARWRLGAIALLGVSAFWVGMAIAAHRYPAEYDWRYMPISNLLSAERDPAGYPWAAGGIAACGLCGLCWAWLTARRWTRAAAGGRPGGLWALLVGNLCMAGAAVPPHWLRPSRAHEIVTVLAFAGLCLGIVDLTARLLARGVLPLVPSAVRHPRRWAAGLAALAALPILSAGLAQVYVFYALPGLGWINLGWRERAVPVYVSFAFWEWVTCGVFAVYVLSLALAMPAALARPRAAGVTSS